MNFFQILFVFLISSLLFFTIDESFGDHGSGGGSGCSGDCTPPTMGLDPSENSLVKNGFTINQKSFDVESFDQVIPTQLSKVGQPVDVSLRIYENSGPFYLSNVKMTLGEKEEFLGGQWVKIYPIQIVWEQGIDGKKSFFVIDENDVISDVNVVYSISDDSAIGQVSVLTYTFVPLSEINLTPIIITMWDHNLSSWTNYFYDSLKIVLDDSSADVISNKPSTNGELVIPDWIKNNAGFWANDLIDDDTFLMGIKYCIQNNIISIPNMPTHQSDDVLHFVDLTKGPQHYIDRYNNEASYKEWFDSNFPGYTIEEAVGVKPVSSKEIPVWIKSNAQWWSEEMIDDESFVAGIEYLIEGGIIVI